MEFTINIPDVSKWHKWFAWHPAEIKGCNFIWFEYVERRITNDYSCVSGIKVEYRKIK